LIIQSYNIFEKIVKYKFLKIYP